MRPRSFAPVFLVLPLPPFFYFFPFLSLLSRFFSILPLTLIFPIHHSTDDVCGREPCAPALLPPPHAPPLTCHIATLSFLLEFPLLPPLSSTPVTSLAALVLRVATMMHPPVRPFFSVASLLLFWVDPLFSFFYSDHFSFSKHCARIPLPGPLSPTLSISVTKFFQIFSLFLFLVLK